MSLSRQDVILGRALLAWGLVPEHHLQGCAEDVRRLSAMGRPITLGEILVQRGFLSIEYYHAIVTRLQQQYLESSSVDPQVQQATENLPYMNQQGGYTRSLPRQNFIEASAVDRAVQGWDSAARDVTASGSNLGQPMPLSSDSGAEPRTRKPPDRAIRKKLGIPLHIDRFPLGAWMVEEYLDAGAQGIVYRVTRIEGDGTPYALKILKQLNASEQVRKRFVQEARTMAKLQHRGIAQVYDGGCTEGFLWFVMDYMSGSNLKEIITNSGPLPLQEALRVMGSLCDAVAYAHSQSILHRDLKPDNVIMSESGQPILTDFGLAKDVDSGMNLTQEGQRLGTPLYMAPELLLNAEKATPQSEVYSLGAMLYQCLTGKVPYLAKSLFDLVDLIEAGKFIPLKKSCPGASRKLDKLCKRALHKDPSKRPQSVVEMRDELVNA